VGQKTVKFSDLSGELIIKDDSLARIVVHEHPELGGGPVEIEVHADEARVIEQAAVQVAVVDLYFPGQDAPQRAYMDLAAFDELSTEQPMSELLTSARPARRGAKSSSSASPARADRLNYSSLEHAGRPHRGKVTDEEKQLVQKNFDEINDGLAAAGLRRISLSDPDHVDRYDLSDLAAERGINGASSGPARPRAAQADKDGETDMDGIDEPAELDDLARTTAA
jgi:hypothetical protein